MFLPDTNNAPTSGAWCMVNMRGVSFSPKRIVFGVALIMTGLSLLIVIPHPLSYQAPPNVLLLSLSIILAYSLTIMFGVWVLTSSSIEMFLWALVIITLWAYLLLLPILLLPLTQEVLPVVIGFSSLPLVVLYVCYFRLKNKRVRDTKGAQR